MMSDVGPILVTILAVVLGYITLHQNRVLAKQRLEFEKKKFENEQADRDRFTEWRKKEERRFLNIATDIADHVSKQLSDEPSWAHQALRSANFLTYKDTVFEARLEHFREEKEALARHFMPYLMARCRKIIERDYRDVYLLIDAGTTLHPFFSLLGTATSSAYQARESWIDRFHLATNNLPGLENLMRTGLRMPSDRYSELAIADCQLLSGKPLPIFGALVGTDTNEAIVKLKSRAVQHAEINSPPFFIALVVGNWVRIDQRTHCPIPMAKGGGDSHLGVKNTMFAQADEVFVVSPLGKLFMNADNDKVNEVLQPHGKERYNDATIGAPSNVKLVATSRGPGRVLREHSIALAGLLGAKHFKDVSQEDFAKASTAALPHLILRHDRLPPDKLLEFFEEFPHEDTRSNHELLELFSLSPSDVEKFERT